LYTYSLTGRTRKDRIEQRGEKIKRIREQGNRDIGIEHKKVRAVTGEK
jgi:hypothetical protein